MTQRLVNFSLQRFYMSIGRISLYHIKLSQVGKGRDMKLDFLLSQVGGKEKEKWLTANAQGLCHSRFEAFFPRGRALIIRPSFSPGRLLTDDMESTLKWGIWRYQLAGREQRRIAIHLDGNKSGHKTRSRQLPRKKNDKQGPRPSPTYKNVDVLRGVKIRLEFRN